MGKVCILWILLAFNNLVFCENHVFNYQILKFKKMSKNTCNYSDEHKNSSLLTEYQNVTLVDDSNTFNIVNPYSYGNYRKPIPGRRVEVRIEPKIGRNVICPKCESGKKYKKCCMKNQNYDT